MSATTLVVSALLTLASSAFFIYVGNVVSRRRASPEARTAVVLFALFWYAFALIGVPGAFVQIGAAFGYTSLPLLEAFTQVALLVICVALWALLYYLVYLFTGRSGLLVPLAVFYLVCWMALVYLVAASNPNGVEVTRWTVALTYESEPTGAYSWILIIFLVVPLIIGALAYFSLFFRTEDPTQRYRIGLVSWSILVWFSSSFAGTNQGVAESDWWQLLSRFIGLAAAWIILKAYHPPGWIQRRYNIVPLEEKPAPGPATA